MFTNPGRKIKGYAKVLFVLQVIIYAIAAIAVLVICIQQGSAVVGIISFIVTAAVGVLIAWISVLVLYGFGAVVEDVRDIKAKISPESVNTDE